MHAVGFRTKIVVTFIVLLDGDFLINIIKTVNIRFYYCTVSENIKAFYVPSFMNCAQRELTLVLLLFSVYSHLKDIQMDKNLTILVLFLESTGYMINTYMSQI